MYHLVLFFSEDEMNRYPEVRANCQKMSSLLEKIASSSKNDENRITSEVCFIEDLSEKETTDLLESLRILSRKRAIGIVTKEGSGPLPISRSKQPGRAGFLVCYETAPKSSRSEKTPVAVYPHLINKKRIDVLPYLSQLSSSGIVDPENADGGHLTEADIARMISTFPDIIEEGLTFEALEVEVRGGRIDAVFRDAEGRPLLVEIEIYARSIAVEQVLKFKTAYAEEHRIRPEDIRIAIVCGRIKDSTLRASASGNVEVYELGLKKVIG